MGHVHEDEPPDGRVERSPAELRQPGDVAFDELDVGHAEVVEARLRGREQLGRALDAEDVASRPDQAPGEQGDVAHPGAQVEDAHAGDDPGLTQVAL